MIYRTFRAPTYKEAVLSAKMELGSDVYILGRKEVKEGGFLGLFTRSLTEITVAKNEDVINSIERKGKKETDIVPRTTEEERKTAPGESNRSAQEEQGAKERDIVLQELNEIKSRLEKMADHRSNEKNNSYLEKLVMDLTGNDFSSEFISRIRSKFECELSLSEVQDPKLLEEKLKGYILNSIDTSGPIEVKEGKPAVVVLVGPTGVGKTTTIAKLAATYGIIQKRRVEMLTIDSYRIAAIEQLGKYAELMQIPYTVINTREEFKHAIVNSTSEIIFVDTAGRSQKNNLGLAEMRNILDGAKASLDIQLVISATTKYRDALDIMTRFNQLMYNKVIITKLDETTTIGSLLSIMNPEKKLSYFTTGQGVPDDIEIAAKEKLLDMIVFEELRAG